MSTWNPPGPYGVVLKRDADPHKSSLCMLSCLWLEQLEVLVDGHGLEDISNEYTCKEALFSLAFGFRCKHPPSPLAYLDVLIMPGSCFAGLKGAKSEVLQFHIGL